MAYTSLLNLSDKTAAPSSRKATELMRDRSDSFSLGTSEAAELGSACPDLSLRDTLRQAFESGGMPLLVTFCGGASFDAGLRSEPASISVRALAVPFSWDELQARVSSLPRRSGTSLANFARFGDISVDFSSMEVSRSSGEQIALTAQEFKALRFFLSNPGRVISRDELLNHAWGYDNYPSTRTVDNHVLKLRQKLEIEPSRPKHFLTVRRVGYKFLP